MKKNGEEFLKIFVNILCVMILCVGFYNLFVNIFHQNYINQSLRVSELDNDYIKYKENIKNIRSNLNSVDIVNNVYDADTTKKLYSATETCLRYMEKDESLFGIKTGYILKSNDVYKLNANFNNELYNSCWIKGMGFINLRDHGYEGYLKNVFPGYDRTVHLSVEISDYVKKELLGNSSYHYRTKNSSSIVRNDLLEQYNMVIHNYRIFSDIILQISDFLAEGDY